ncbi:MAG: DUF4838 domain-containing protein [Pirellulales bacterium]|nr:DUF4838 domain-containing protein [Pirellulales bacterium]
MNISATIIAATIATIALASSVFSADRPAVAVAVEGKSDWRIELASKDIPVVQWAAKELQTSLRRMSRRELPIGDFKPARPAPAIVLGLRKDFSVEDRSILPRVPRGFDGYAIAVLPGREQSLSRILLAGENDRGAIYAAYDLLERFGCRWFYPTQDENDPEVVPKQSTLSIASGSWAVASPFKYRICNPSSWIYEMDYPAAAKQLDWAMKNRYNCMAWGPVSNASMQSQYRQLKEHGLLAELSKRAMLLYGPGHCFDQLLKADDYMAEHPQWFGMRDGKRVPQTFFGAQFCWSNPQARKQFAENAAVFLDACPEISILSLMPFDGGKSCDCPECNKAGASNLLMLLLGETIDRIEKKYPQVVVETLGGYGNVSAPPTNAKIHPRQRVVWAHWGRYHGTPYDDERYAERKNLELWHKAASGGLTAGQYYGDNFCQPWIMPPFAMAIEGDRRYLIEKKIDSVFVLMWPPGYWWNHGLNGYLAGRCFFDPSLDPYREIHDYARHYFGPAAGPALAAYYEQWARQIDLAYRVRGGASEADVAMLAAQRAKWLQPAMTAAKDDAPYAYRLSKVKQLHAIAERMAESSRQNEEIDRLRKEGKIEEAKKCLDRLRTTTEHILQLAHANADLNQGLIDKQTFDAFVAPGLKSRIEERAKALAKKDEK